MIEDIVFSLDVLRPEANLLFFKERKFKSCWSLFFSFFYIAFTLFFYFYVWIFLYIYSSQPSVSYIKKSNLMTREQKLKDIQFSFGIYNYKTGKMVNLTDSLFYFEANLWNLTYEENLEIEECKRGINFKKNFFKELNVSNLKCFKNLNNQSLKSDFGYNDYLELRIQLKTKDPEKELNITNFGLYFEMEGDDISFQTNIPKISEEGFEFALPLKYKINAYYSLIEYLHETKTFLNLFKSNLKTKKLVKVSDYDFENLQSVDNSTLSEISINLDRKQHEFFKVKYAKLKDNISDLICIFIVFRKIFQLLIWTISTDKVNNEILQYVTKKKREAMESLQEKDRLRGIKPENNPDLYKSLLAFKRKSTFSKIHQPSSAIFKAKFCRCCCKRNQVNYKFIEESRKFVENELNFENLIDKLLLVDSMYSVLGEEDKEKVHEMTSEGLEKVFKASNNKKVENIDNEIDQEQIIECNELNLNSVL